MSLIQYAESGTEHFIGYAKKKLRELHDYMTTSGVASFAKRIDVDDGTAIYLNSLKVKDGLFVDKVRIVGGRFGSGLLIRNSQPFKTVTIPSAYSATSPFQVLFSDGSVMASEARIDTVSQNEIAGGGAGWNGVSLDIFGYSGGIISAFDHTFQLNPPDDCIFPLANEVPRYPLLGSMIPSPNTGDWVGTTSVITETESTILFTAYSNPTLSAIVTIGVTQIVGTQTDVVDGNTRTSTSTRFAVERIGAVWIEDGVRIFTTTNGVESLTSDTRTYMHSRLAPEYAAAWDLLTSGNADAVRYSTSWNDGITAFNSRRMLWLKKNSDDACMAFATGDISSLPTEQIKAGATKTTGITLRLFGPVLNGVSLGMFAEPQYFTSRAVKIELLGKIVLAYDQPTDSLIFRSWSLQGDQIDAPFADGDQYFAGWPRFFNSVISYNDNHIVPTDPFERAVLGIVI